MTESPKPEEPQSSPPLVRILGGLGALAALVLLGRFLGDSIEPFKLWVAGLGALGPIVFVLGYAVAVVGFAPASILTLAAGGIFGLAHGVVYVFFAATLGSTAAFLVARYLARSAIEKRIEAEPRFAAIDRAIGNEGRKIVFLLRLTPAIPFNLLNYALGLTKVSLTDYLVAGFGMIPGTFLYVYLGYLATETAAAAGGGGAELGRWALNIVALGATVAVTLYVTVLARRALAEATDEEKEEA
ncbi:MAG: TVP38/TMEM64 family protein [bacterium]|nr:TVP38/TMEM64 family protein [bacterium]MCP5071228.1 TVP38/TMEM64 family protein [bacterium]